MSRYFAEFGEKRMSVKDATMTPRAPRLFLEISEHEGTGVVRCRGRICFREEALHFSRTVVELLLSGRSVVLDFSGVEFVDSAGLGELVLVHMQAQAAESSVCLVAPIPQVQRLLKLTNIGSLFEIYPTVEDAQASLAPHAV